MDDILILMYVYIYSHYEVHVIKLQWMWALESRKLDFPCIVSCMGDFGNGSVRTEFELSRVFFFINRNNHRIVSVIVLQAKNFSFH